MSVVTFQVLEGIDRGRVFREIETPITIGREEGNVLRLNDERVSRFHAKIQADNGEIILTDLVSTNGTRVNGNVVQIRRLRIGDRVGVGRSLLLFGSEEEIAARHAELSGVGSKTPYGDSGSLPSSTILPQTMNNGDPFEQDLDFDVSLHDKFTHLNGALYLGNRALPPLPERMSPSQAARFAEVLDFLHRHLTQATENVQANEEGSLVALNYGDWQRILTLQMLLARYSRSVAEPDAMEE